jgi:hypothetical protein
LGFIYRDRSAMIIGLQAMLVQGRKCLPQVS